MGNFSNFIYFIEFAVRKKKERDKMGNQLRGFSRFLLMAVNNAFIPFPAYPTKTVVLSGLHLEYTTIFLHLLCRCMVVHWKYAVVGFAKSTPAWLSHMWTPMKEWYGE